MRDTHVKDTWWAVCGSSSSSSTSSPTQEVAYDMKLKDAQDKQQACYDSDSDSSWSPIQEVTSDMKFTDTLGAISKYFWWDKFENHEL